MKKRETNIGQGNENRHFDPLSAGGDVAPSGGGRERRRWIKLPLLGPESVLALADIRQLVVRMKAIETDNLTNEGN